MVRKLYTPTLALISVLANRAAIPKGDSEIAAGVPMSIHIFRAVMAGDLPVPIELVLPLAAMLNIDRGLLFSVWLRDYAPEIDVVMREIVGEYFLESENELLAKSDQVLAAGDPQDLSAAGPILEDLLAFRQRREASG